MTFLDSSVIVNMLEGVDETVALEAARLQDELLTAGDRVAGRDLLIAAIARSSGDHLVVADSDFETDALESTTQVTKDGRVALYLDTSTLRILCPRIGGKIGQTIWE
ncbi:PIN domain-containing protein [Natrinema salaciae]|uniref:PIN domain-containing protein n=1 Tax=Natrinema salaciae TaxID=1186196 RepID=A0A1H9R0Z6_9EURY|nr:hypothetical protein [Natrinema salaciae]SER66501.1 hypothetical protein SAMN04489841_4243 [Natrinema salaciae]